MLAVRPVTPALRSRSCNLLQPMDVHAMPADKPPRCSVLVLLTCIALRAAATAGVPGPTSVSISNVSVRLPVAPDSKLCLHFLVITEVNHNLYF